MKKKKGMTLMEIIVSCAIYAMFSLLICEVMTLVNSTMKATNQLNRRLSYESKNADNMVTTETSGNRTISYQITYNDTGLKYVRVNPNDTTGGVWDRSNGSHPQAIKNGKEYTANYPDAASIVGTNYCENVNYRFMTFTRATTLPSDYRDDNFNIQIRIVPYFTEDDSRLSDAEKNAAIARANANAASMRTLTVQATDGPGLHATTGVLDLPPHNGSNYELKEHFDFLVHNNSAPPLPDGTRNVHGDLEIKVRGLQINNAGTVLSSTEDKWTEFTCTYYQYVKIGVMTSNETYYNAVLIEYNLAERKFKIIDSYVDESAYPPLPTYY